MKVTPCIYQLVTDEHTENDPDVQKLYNNLIVIYMTQIIKLSKIEMHDDLTLKHYFGVYILKEIDTYRVVTSKTHVHEIYLGSKHYGNAYIMDDNKSVLNKRQSNSVYDKMEMDNSYKTLDINKIAFDFSQLFKNTDQEHILLEITKF